MIKIGLAFLLSVFVVNTFAQTDNAQFELKIYYGSEDNRTSFCSDSVKVAPFIKIEGDGFNEANEGIRISISNYKRNEDVLVYRGSKNFNVNWNDSYGYLEITGIGTAQEYQQAVKDVYYKNTNTVPNLEDRYISVTLKDADYLPATKHFYKFIKKLDITWTEARDSAENMTYNGLSGYLGTITSSVENDFIWTKIDGVGWIGATDEETEGIWKWATGPEAGIQFWQGTYNNGYAVNGRFSYWSEAEPNNAHAETNNGIGEDYGHINQDPSKRIKSWNDLRINGDGPTSQYYRPRGFIVEFGGMPGDPELQLSATSIVEIQKIAFSDKRDVELCAGESIKLNDIKLPEANQYNYIWTPTQNISDPNLHNPLVSPSDNTTYKVVGVLKGCVAEAEFTVKVNSLPVSELDPVYVICKGSSVVLNPGEHESYLWGSGETSKTITVSEEGVYSVLFANQFGCTRNTETSVRYSVAPQLDYEKVDTLVCGAKQQKLNLAFESGQAVTLLQALQTNAQVTDESTLSPTIEVGDFGKYGFAMQMTDIAGCTFTDTLNIEFHNQPAAQFQLDQATCAGYNLQLEFTGETYEDATFNWYSNDTLFSSETNKRFVEIPLGYGSLNRSVGLKINEQGCVDSSKLSVTVKPVLDFWPEQKEGCTPLNVQFNSSSTEPVDKFYWDFGDGNVSNTDKPIHLFYNPGTSDKNFDVSLKIVSAEGCENTGTIRGLITVHPTPSIDFDFSEQACLEGVSQVNYVGSATDDATFLWDLSDFGANEILINPGNSRGPLEFERTAKPTVKIGLQVISEFNCKTDSIIKTFSRKPLFDVEMNKQEGCPPLEVDFSAEVADNVDEVDFFWDFGDGKNATGQTATHVFLQPGTAFQVQVFARSLLTGCADTFLIPEKINVFSQPVAGFNAVPNTVLISHPVVRFENTSNDATFYEWDFDDQSVVSGEEDPQHRFDEMGLYNVQLTALNDLGCADTFSHQVAVVFDQVYPPNAFSPNATLEEDREFRIYAEGIVEEGYKLLIFNRWGEIIFESASPKIGWDGKMANGNFAPAGTYTWVIQFTDFRGENHKQQGNVTLLF
jgi:gliding motility-associated-like protein